MRKKDYADLILLAALWGASYVFMRMIAADFGAIPLAGVRVALASLLLVPIVAYRREFTALRRHWRHALVVGIGNSALPFVLYTYAALHITASLSAVFNASTPLFGAAIAWLWLKDRLNGTRILGLVLGFAGVFGLAWSKSGEPLTAGSSGATETLLAILACLAGSLSYGISAAYAKRYLQNLPSMALAAGSQFGAAVVLCIPTVWLWPEVNPAAGSWLILAGLAVFCTSLAYFLYFRLINNAGPANALSVTFLVPVFAILWGFMLLHEVPGIAMILGGILILAGTALVTGLLPRKRSGSRP